MIVRRVHKFMRSMTDDDDDDETEWNRKVTCPVEAEAYRWEGYYLFYCWTTNVNIEFISKEWGSLE